jgi:hypothetical protein
MEKIFIIKDRETIKFGLSTVKFVSKLENPNFRHLMNWLSLLLLKLFPVFVLTTQEWGYNRRTSAGERYPKHPVQTKINI